MQPNRARLIHRDALQYAERFGIDFSLDSPLGEYVRFNSVRFPRILLTYGRGIGKSILSEDNATDYFAKINS